MPKFHKAKEGDKIPISDYNLKSDFLEALANMKVTGGRFKIDRAGASLDVTQGPQTLLYWVRLTTPISPATGPVDSGAFIGQGIRLKSVGGDAGETLQDSDTEQEIRITNRDPNFEAEAGDIILVARVQLGTLLEWQPVNPFGGSPQTEEDDVANGFPFGTGGCNCGNCKTGITIPSATVCCTSFLEWEFIDPWVGGLRKLQYAGSDTWVTHPFDGPECACTEGGDCDCLGDPEVTCANEFRWVLTPSLTAGSSVLELEVVTDNGCNSTCIKYKKVLTGWQCQCENQMELSPDWAGLEEGQKLACRICVKPVEPVTDYTGGNWISGVCGVSPEDLPLIWEASADSFEGLRCAGTAQNTSWHSWLKYAGSYSTASGIFDVFCDTNIIFTRPLVRLGNVGGTWAITPSYQDPDCPARSGIVIGQGLGGAPSVSFPCGDPNANMSSVQSTVELGKATCSVSCTYTPSTDTYVLTVFYNMVTCAPLIAPTVASGSRGFNSYSFQVKYTDILLEDIPCTINQAHTLTRITSTQPGDIASDAAGAGSCNVFDPLPDDLHAPTEITLTPYGGGPPDCPNLGDIPPDPGPTNSGACTTCTPDSTTPDPDDGSCCSGGACLQYISEALCTALGGDMYDNQALCEDDCFKAACCATVDVTTSCTDGLSRDDCLLLDPDATWSSGATCDDVFCNSDVVATTFTSSGTFTAPAGVSVVIIECWGAGGGGTSNGPGATGGGAGGGGGGFAKKNSYSVTPGNNYTVVVGTGGAGNPSGTGGTGGQSYFDNTSVCAASGGSGGSSDVGGSGGTGTAGDVLRTGGAGGDTNDEGGGGGGGAAGTLNDGAPGEDNLGTGSAAGGAGGTAGGGNGGAGGATGAAGSDGSATGGGGGGGGDTTPDSQAAAGDGADGKVIVYYVV